MQHSFDISIAEKYGVNAAIFLNHLSFWIKKNQANKKHFHDGRHWTYNTIQAYSVLFPYWTPKQIRLVLDNLKKIGILVTGNYNSNQYDRTQWYSLSDEGHSLLGLPICPNGKMEITEIENGFAEKGKPIPDIKPDIKPVKNNKNKKNIFEHAKETFEFFWTNYKRKKDKTKAFQIWCKKRLWEKSEDIVAKLIQQNSYDSQYQNLQFIPHPTTYLRNERWEDDITRKSESSVTTVFNELKQDYLRMTPEEKESFNNFLN